MATVMYLPEWKSIGGSLGEGVGSGIGKYAEGEMKKEEQRRQMEAFKKMGETIKAAGSREKALDMVTQGEFTDIQQFKTVMDFVDTIYPAGKDPDITEVKAYSPDGKESTGYVKKGEVSNLNNPGIVQEMFGKDYSLTKPVKADSNTSEMNSVIAQQRFFEQSVGNLLNVPKTIGMDGSWSFNFEGDEKKTKAYQTAMQNASKYITKYGGDVAKAAHASLADQGIFNEPPPAAPEPEAAAEDEPGFLSKAAAFIADKAASVFTDAPASKPAAPKAPAPKGDAIPSRPSDVPPEASYSPSQKSWWWKDSKGQWKSKKGK